MKLIAVLSLTLLFLGGCDRQEDRINRKYVLENSTNRTLNADFYINGEINYSRVVTGTGILAEGKATNDSGGNLSAFAAFQSDSVVVTFDNEKRQTYLYYPEMTPKQRNILSDSAYQIENIELYRFIFTEEDYNNAELIEK